MPFFNLGGVSGGQKTSGAVKINQNVGGTEPTLNLVAGVPQQIIYTDPELSSEIYFPDTAPAQNVTSIYGDVTVGATPYTGIFKENPVLGQPQIWRISFNYSGKATNLNEGLYLRLVNPISGFVRRKVWTLPTGEGGNDFLTVNITTYADTASLHPDQGGTGTGGYQMFFETIAGNLQIIVKDVSRFNFAN